MRVRGLSRDGILGNSWKRAFPRIFLTPTGVCCSSSSLQQLHAPRASKGGEVKQQTPGSSITRRGNNRILVLVKVVTLKWLWRPLPAGLARAQLHGGQFQVVRSASATLDRPSFEFYASAALRVRRYHQSDFESGRFSPGSLSPSSCPRSWCHVVSTNAFHAVVRGWHVPPGDPNQTSAGLRL